MKEKGLKKERVTKEGVKGEVGDGREDEKKGVHGLNELMGR